MRDGDILGMVLVMSLIFLSNYFLSLGDMVLSGEMVFMGGNPKGFPHFKAVFSLGVNTYPLLIRIGWGVCSGGIF